jgi:GntR family transcriptional regulator, rspAB operon transcriptional repressor
MSALEIDPLDRMSGVAARHQVYLTLREEIVSARLAPGLRLSESELAAELGVSRTPIREALARLRDERLVAIVPQLGTFATLISPQAVADAEFVREALECAAIARAVPRTSTEDLEELQSNLMAQERARVAGDECAFDGLDEEFHRRLCDYSGHSIAWSLSRRANGHLDRVRRLSMPDADYLTDMVAQHTRIVSAIAAGDTAAAESAMREHVRMVASYLPRLYREHPGYFEHSDEPVE